MGCFGISLREETWGLGRPNETWGCSKCRYVCGDCYSEVTLIKIWIENANPKSISNQVLPSESLASKFPDEQKLRDTLLLMCGPLQYSNCNSSEQDSSLLPFIFVPRYLETHTHTHIERAPKRSEAEAVGGGSVWSNPSRKVSKAECRTSNT